MAETLWADYSWARPTVDRYEGVMRYLYANRGTRPDLTGAEVNDLHQQGKPIGLIWQADKAGAGEGKQRGADDSQRANREADKLGAPDTAAIFYTVDADLSPEQVAGYFAGVRSVPGGRPVGIYGSARIIDWAHSEGIPWRWQTRAWSRGVISKHAHLYQRDHNVEDKPPTGLLDRNVKYADFPAWEPKGAKPKPKPKPKEASVKVIDRSEWGARHPDGFDDRPMPITEMWLHHSVTVAPDLVPPFTDDDEAVRTLERIGQSRFGGGISYTRPVTPVGRIYEGHSLHRRGAHTKGHNTVGMAYCLVGNYDSLAPTRAQKVAIARDMVELHRAGKATRHTLNGGHRDVSSTACPGAKGYAAIPEINRIANEMWAGKDYDLGTATGDVWQPTGALTTKQVQALLGITADGIYGPATTAAVRDLQTALNLTADGLWGPTTEGAVMSLQSDIKALSAKIDEVEEWTRKAVNNSLYSGPQRVISSLSAVLADTQGVDVDKLASAIAEQIRDDVAQAGSGATAEQIADVLAERLSS